MNEVVLRGISEPIPREADPIASMIERAARDPSVDIDKLERLIAMRERRDALERERAFDAAMAAAQSKMRAVAADANNPQTRSKYASYFALDKAIRPIYTEHGFSLSFETGETKLEGHVRVICRISCAGHTRSPYIDMPADGKGAKGGDVMTKTHAAGAAVSYGSRYLLKMIFNIAVGEDDKDGNAEGDTQTITAEQAEELSALIVKGKTDISKFLKWAKAESVADIQAKFFDDCKAKLEVRAKQAEGVKS